MNTESVENKTDSVSVKKAGQDFYFFKKRKDKFTFHIQKTIFNMYFIDLPKINKERVDSDLLLAELKDGHDDMVKKLFDVLIEDENIFEINDFISWSNQYLAQLVSAVCGKYITDIEEKLEFISQDKRQLANYNDLQTIKKAMDNFTVDNVIRLVKAEESSNMYPLSKEGVSFLKDFHKLTKRMENMFEKISDFSKTKVR